VRVPSSQLAALWVKSEVVSVEWISLTELCFTAVTKRWSGKSEEEVWEFVEKNIAFIAEHLRDEASLCLIDGSAPKFDIDDEQPPYIKSVGTPTNEVLDKLRSIDPFKVEEICADILKGFGAAAYATQRTADGGIDFIAANLNIVPKAFAVPAGCRATIIGQTKRYRDGNAITEKKMREFVGAG
jgi:restriction endonuclease Mrr